MGIDFDILDYDFHLLVGWKKVTGNMLFNVNMDFLSNSRWVFDGNRTTDPEGSLYDGVVLRESIRKALTYMALNVIDVVAADIRNPNIQAPSSQKDYNKRGTEFELENVGKNALIRRTVYGGKSSGHEFRNYLRECMHRLNFDSCP